MRMDKLTGKFQAALADAQSLAVGRDQQLIEPAHVLLALLEQSGGTVRPLVLKAGANLNRLRTDLTTLVDQLPSVQKAGIYQVMADSHNNLWMAEFTEGHLGKIDAKTGAVTWYATPTAHARARRMEIDDQDRVLVTEYRTSKAALFDPKTEQFTEYAFPQYTFPYRANFDKNGEIWASTMSTDRVVRLDPSEIDHARRILARGTSAHRQLAHYREALEAGATPLEALQSVVDWLIEETVRRV